VPDSATTPMKVKAQEKAEAEEKTEKENK